MNPKIVKNVDLNLFNPVTKARKLLENVDLDYVNTHIEVFAHEQHIPKQYVHFAVKPIFTRTNPH